MMKQVCKAFLFLVVSAVAQESQPRVAIPVIAIGVHHRPTSITVESLVITDQKMRVTGASLLRGVDLPVELGVLIDASNSQRNGHLEDILSAAKQFVDVTIRGAEDRAFFLRFQDEAEATGWLKKEQLKDTTIKVGAGGGTALYDALSMACKQRMAQRDWRKPTRRVLVLISDGDDNASQIARDEALSDVLTSGAVIFTINTDDSGLSSKGEKVMEHFAKLTGGESFSRLSRSEIPKVFAAIQELIDGMYSLSYLPPDASKSAVHEVELKPAPKAKIELSYPRKYLWNP